MASASSVALMSASLSVERGMRLQYVDEANLAGHSHLTKGLHRQRMGDKYVVAGLNGARRIADRRGDGGR